MISDWEVALDRVTQRNRDEQSNELAIDATMMEAFRNQYEEVQASEGFEVIAVNANMAGEATAYSGASS